MTIDGGRLDRDRSKELFDLRKSANSWSGGDLDIDPHPTWHELRERIPVLFD